MSGPIAGNGGKQQKSTRRLGGFSWFIIFAAAVAIVVAMIVFFGQGDPEIDKVAEQNESCKTKVLERLNSPSNADFFGTPANDGELITGEVDAQNGFGALIRSDYQCIIGDEVIVVDFIR